MKEYTGGFTLIEIIVVSGIMIIILGIIIVGVPEMRGKGRDAIRVKDFDRIVSGLETYYNRNGHYPEIDPIGMVYGASSNEAGWTILETSLNNIIGHLPKDPINDTDYHYTYCLHGDAPNPTDNPHSYALMVDLETNHRALESDYDYNWPEDDFGPRHDCCKCNGSAAKACSKAQGKEPSPENIYCIRNP